MYQYNNYNYLYIGFFHFELKGVPNWLNGSIRSSSLSKTCNIEQIISKDYEEFRHFTLFVA